MTDQSTDNQIIGVGEWMITILLVSIPLVNVVMFFVWACSANKTKRNFVAAVFFWILLLIVISYILNLFGTMTTHRWF
jgi:hypothetical protein